MPRSFSWFPFWIVLALVLAGCLAAPEAAAPATHTAPPVTPLATTIATTDRTETPTPSAPVAGAATRPPLASATPSPVTPSPAAQPPSSTPMAPTATAVRSARPGATPVATLAPPTPVPPTATPQPAPTIVAAIPLTPITTSTLAPTSTPTPPLPVPTATPASAPTTIITQVVAVTPTAMPLLSGRIDVALDPGHSLSDPGATGAGLAEYELTLPLARKVRDRLAARGIAVVLTRTDDAPLTAYTNPDPTTRIRLEQQARIAAGAGARIYVSLHFNGHSNTSARGSSVYYNPSNHGARSHRLATLLQESIVSHARDRLGYRIVDIGVLEDLSAGKPYGHFFSLRGPFPSALVEAMYLTNPEEAELLTRDETLDVLADACAEGIHAYLAEVDALFQQSR